MGRIKILYICRAECFKMPQFANTQIFALTVFGEQTAGILSWFPFHLCVCVWGIMHMCCENSGGGQQKLLDPWNYSSWEPSHRSAKDGTQVLWKSSKHS